MLSAHCQPYCSSPQCVDRWLSLQHSANIGCKLNLALLYNPLAKRRLSISMEPAAPVWETLYAETQTEMRVDKNNGSPNTLRLRQDGRDFVADIFKFIFLYEICCISIKCYWNLFPKGHHWFRFAYLSLSLDEFIQCVKQLVFHDKIFIYMCLLVYWWMPESCLESKVVFGDAKIV